MEKRAVFALILCGLVLVIHMMFVAKKPPRTVPPEDVPGDNVTVPAVPTHDNVTRQPTPTVQPQPRHVGAQPQPAQPIQPQPAVPSVQAAYIAADQDKIEVKHYTVESDRLTSSWTNEFTGACLDVTFKDFYVTVKREENLKLLGAFESLVLPDGRERRVLGMALEFPEIEEALARMKMHATQADDGSLTFRGKILQRNAATGRYEDFLEVTKTVRVSPEGYEIEMKVGLRNLTSVPMAMKYGVRVLEGVTVEDGWRSGATARVGLLSEKAHPMVKEEAVGKIKDAPWGMGSGNVIWGGLDDRYFVALLYAEGRETMESASFEPIRVRLKPKAQPVQTVRVKLAMPLRQIDAGGSDLRRFHLFVGPKKRDVLAQYENLGLPQLVDFGMFGIISHLLLWILRAIHAVVRNYGVAIILLTAIIRVALHRFTRKSQVAMHKMQKLKPKIQELQKKYKGDKQKLGKEQMELFRKHGVSPLSGCLPMLLQMPVLFALFWALRLTFELRQEPFALWITDLSLPDTVGRFPGGIPFIGGAAINILPLLMTVAMFLQQKMMPKSDDPQSQQQQKFMGLLPFFFAFLFYKFPSGLCLYWFTSTVFGMGEQYFIRRHLAQMEGLPAPAGAVAEKSSAGESSSGKYSSKKPSSGRPGKKKKK